jgi:hypothetical protein
MPWKLWLHMMETFHQCPFAPCTPSTFGPNNDTLNALILFALLEKQHVLLPFRMYCELIGVMALSQELVSSKELKTL